MSNIDPRWIAQQAAFVWSTAFLVLCWLGAPWWVLVTPLLFAILAWRHV